MCTLPAKFNSSQIPQHATGVCIQSLSRVQLFATPTDYNPPGSSVCGVLQASRLEWVAISSSRGSSQPRDRTRICCVSCFGRQVFNHWTTWDTWNGNKPYYWVPCTPPSSGRLLPGITERAWTQDLETTGSLIYLTSKWVNRASLSQVSLEWNNVFVTYGLLPSLD